MGAADTPGERTRMSFAAGDGEFRNRFWIIGAAYGVGFFLYSIDKTPVAIAFARRIVGSGAGEDSSQFGHTIRLSFAFGTLLVFLAALVRSWATAYLQASVVHDADLHSERLLADGPYRHLRNPLYLGNILMAVGIGFLASRTGFVVIVVVNILIVLRLIAREEAGLLASQGESYRRYYEAVPSLLPSIRPRVSAGTGQPNWRDGFFGESFVWGFAVGMAAFTVTLNIAYYYVCMSLGFAVYFLQSYWRSRDKAKL
jgi:protein-S-isoprenylcysteine O-methyltransferase Ste14